MKYFLSGDRTSSDEQVDYIDVRALGGNTVDLPDVNWLTSADFKRMGPDLLVEGPNGEKFFIIGFFENGNSLDLVGLGGTKIPFSVVEIMSGSKAPNQYAQAVELNQVESIGIAETVEGNVFAIRVDGTRVQIEAGDPIFQGDTIETMEDGIIGITFADDSTMSLDADARLVIDEMVYDPGSQDGTASLFVLQGAMSFVSGAIAKVNPDAVKIDTPVATIGIRGTSVVLYSAPSEENDAGPPNVTVGMVPEVDANGNEFVGELFVATQGGSQVVGGAFKGIAITDPQAPPPPPATISLNELGSVFGTVLTSNPNSGTVPPTVREVVVKVKAQKQAEEDKAAAENKVNEAAEKVAEAKAALEANDTPENREKLAEAEGELQTTETELQEADVQLQQTTFEAGTAVNSFAQQSGDPALASNTNLTGNNTGGLGNQGDPRELGTQGPEPGGEPGGETPPGDTPPEDPQVILNDTPPEPIFVPDPIPLTAPLPPEPIAPPPEPEPEPEPEPVRQPVVVPDPELNVSNIQMESTTEDTSSTFTLAELNSSTNGTITAVGGRSIQEGAWEDNMGYPEYQSVNNGSLSFDGTTFVFMPDADFTGNTTLSFQVSGFGETTTAQIQMNYSNVNDAPVVSAATSFSMIEDGSLKITTADLTANATDVDLDTLTVSNLSADGGTLTDNGDGTWTFDPVANFNGNINLTYDVSDGTTQTAASGVISVNSVNVAPEFVGLAGDAMADTELTTTTYGDHNWTQTVVQPDGSYIMFYMANPTNTANNWNIYGQLFDADHNKIGTETRIDDTSLTDDSHSSYNTFATTTDVPGEYMIAFRTGASNVAADVVVKRLTTSSSGIDASGTEHLVHDASPYALRPGIQYLGNDKYIVAWDENGADVRAQIVDGSGNLLGSQVVVADNAMTINISSMKVLSNGDIGIIAHAANAATNSVQLMSVYSFDDTTNALTAKFSSQNIVSSPQGAEFHGDFEQLANGNLMVVWVDNTSRDGSGQGIYANIIDPSTGATIVADFNVNVGQTSGQQSFPAIEALSDGTVIVAWTDETALEGNAGVYARRYDQDGNPIGDIFRAAASTTDVQTLGEITDFGNGIFQIQYTDYDGGRNTEYRFFSTNGTDTPLPVQVVDGMEDTVFTITEADLLSRFSDGDGDNLTISNVSVDGTTVTPSSGTYSYLPPANFSGKLDMLVTVSDGTTTTTGHIWIDVAENPNVAPDFTVAGLSTSLTQGATVADTYIRMETGDFNNDGAADIAVSGTENFIEMNDGSGNFTKISLGSGSASYFVTGDVNNDGYDDIVYGEGKVLINNQDNTFTETNPFSTVNRKPNLADVDGDGDLDLMVLNQSTAPQIYLNDGSGGFSATGHTFTQQQTYFNDTASVFADFDGDGDNDVILGGWGQHGEIWENTGGGTYSFVTILNNSYDGTLIGSTLDFEQGDFDGDGDVDIFVNNRYGPSMVYFNDGDGNLTFTHGGNYGGSSDGVLPGGNGRQQSTIGDLDGDGDLDIVAGHWDGWDLYLINDGFGNFTQINDSGQVPLAANVSYGSVMADFTGDGWTDVFRGSYNANYSWLYTNAPVLSVTEDTVYNGQVNGTDANNDTLTYTATNGSNGTVTMDSSTGAFTYTPAAGYTGSDAFTITANDGNGGTTTKTINVTVNSAPPDQQINSTVTAETQDQVNGAALADGGWVQIYRDASSSSDLWDIYAQIYNADGSKRGSEIYINNGNSSNYQNIPNVIGLTGGDWVAIWNTNSGTGNLQHFDANGNTTVAAQVVGNGIQTDQSDLIQLSNGGYAVVYKEEAGGDYSDIFFVEYDASGAVTETNVQVNTYTNQHQLDPDITQTNGKYFIVWSETDSASGVQGIQGRIYDPNSNAFDAVPFQLVLDGNARHPALTTLDNDNIVMTYQTNVGVMMTILDSTGAEVLAPVTVDAISANYNLAYEYSDVQTLNNGYFIVVWQNDADDSNGTPDTAIYGQIFNSSGTAVTGTFQVNDTTTGIHRDPSVLVLNDGDFIVSWTADVSTDYNVYQQRFSYSNGSATKVCLDGTNTDPIVIDLDGDGVEMVSAAEGVQFDVNGDGDKEQIGWAGADDGLLAFDVNGDGIINDMSEVVSHYFSYQDRNGEAQLDRSADVLALYDDNQDGRIDEQDEIYDGLGVWQDANGDGITDEGEFRSLADEGIEAIDLEHEEIQEENAGNEVTGSGSAVYENGRVTDWSEVTFDIELDEDPMAAIAQAELSAEATNIDEQNNTLNETALLKEIVGIEQDIHLPKEVADPVETVSEIVSLEAVPEAQKSENVILDNAAIEDAAYSVTVLSDSLSGNKSTDNTQPI